MSEKKRVLNLVELNELPLNEVRPTELYLILFWAGN